MIRDLHAQGLSIKTISKKIGFDRKTVHKYLNSISIPESKKRAEKQSKLDEFKDYITTKLYEGPYTASRLHREIQEMGFTGKYTIFKDFVQKIRLEYGVPVVLRYETKQEVQSQVDWSEFGRVEIVWEYKYIINGPSFSSHIYVFQFCSLKVNILVSLNSFATFFYLIPKKTN